MMIKVSSYVGVGKLAGEIIANNSAIVVKELIRELQQRVEEPSAIPCAHEVDSNEL